MVISSLLFPQELVAYGKQCTRSCELPQINNYTETAVSRGHHLQSNQIFVRVQDFLSIFFSHPKHTDTVTVDHYNDARAGRYSLHLLSHIQILVGDALIER